MPKFDVIGLGMATMDILTTVSHLPESNEVFAADDIRIQGGGPVATALVGLSVLGAKTSYLGTIAPDNWGNSILKEFEHYKVDTSHVDQTNTGTSSVAVILIEKDKGDRAILYKKSDLPELNPDTLTADLITQAKILHLDGVHMEAAIRAAQLAHEHGMLVSFDGGAGEPWPGIERLLPLVDILVVARQFAAQMTGLTDPLQSGPALLKWGANEVVVTDGENGSWYCDKEINIFQPAYQVDVVDTTGAGDTFHGAYLYAFLQNLAPQQRLAFASAAAAMKCTKIGGRVGIPTRLQTEIFMKNYQFGGSHETKQ
ncbi:MAG: carbohydrate kinase [Anaerolineaceae bacterium]|nr:carbohydrate kinase [Anaerolineaceae bacterium]